MTNLSTFSGKVDVPPREYADIRPPLGEVWVLTHAQLSSALFYFKEASSGNLSSRAYQKMGNRFIVLTNDVFLSVKNNDSDSTWSLVYGGFKAVQSTSEIAYRNAFLTIPAGASIDLRPPAGKAYVMKEIQGLAYGQVVDETTGLESPMDIYWLADYEYNHYYGADGDTGDLWRVVPGAVFTNSVFLRFTNYGTHEIRIFTSFVEVDETLVQPITMVTQATIRPPVGEIWRAASIQVNGGYAYLEHATDGRSILSGVTPRSDQGILLTNDLFIYVTGMSGTECVAVVGTKL